jgi:hypothetical protein
MAFGIGREAEQPLILFIGQRRIPADVRGGELHFSGDQHEQLLLQIIALV